MQRISFDEAMREGFGYHPNHGRRLIKQGKLPPPLRDHDGGRPYYTDEIIEQHRAERMAAREQEAADVPRPA
jgi:hypothetical protein